MTGLLSDKNAIIYGGGGSIGSAVARTFAREGATVHLVGRTRSSLEAAAEGCGGRAEIAVLDALDEAAVDRHAAAVAAGGGLHVSFNLVTRGDRQGTPLIDMATEDYLHAIATAARTAFVTA